MKLTAKLIINVVHHGLGVKKSFSSRVPKIALNGGFLPFYLTEKRRNILHRTNQGSNFLGLVIAM